jgi:hypothetical protein
MTRDLATENVQELVVNVVLVFVVLVFGVCVDFLVVFIMDVVGFVH